MLINENELQKILTGVLNEMYEGNDTNRDITNDKLGDFVNKIPSGSAVHVGYLTEETLPLKRANVNSENSAKMNDFISGLSDDTMFHDYISNDIVNGMNDYVSNDSPKKPKTYNFKPNEKYKIIKFQEYSMNWMTREGVAKFYADNSQKVMDLRKKYGFGPDVDPEDEANWRNKSHILKTGPHAGEKAYDYGGPGLRPITRTSGSTFKDTTGEEGFHDSWRDPKTGKYAIRQKPTAYGDPIFFLYNTETKQGEMLGKDFFYFLKKAFGSSTAKQAMQGLAQDEMEYIKELELLNKESSKVWSLLEERTLFISYTSKAPSGEKMKRRIVNPDLMNEYGAIINQMGLNGRVDVAESKIISQSKELNEVKNFMNRLNRI